jgi:hypothetical protein
MNSQELNLLAGLGPALTDYRTLSTRSYERLAGIEPATYAWKALMLPLHHRRMAGTNKLQKTGGGSRFPLCEW